MTYRNDHDAAVARATALQTEVNRLNAALRQSRDTPPPVTRKRKSRLRAVLPAIAGVLVGAAVLTATHRGAVGSDATSEAPANEVRAPPATSPVPTDAGLEGALRHCIGGLVTPPEIEGRIISAGDLERIRATPAACHAELEAAVSRRIGDVDLTVATMQWLGAEDKLGNVVSMLVTYHGSDPYRLDNYATARQLWREYERAYAERQLAVAEWLDAK